MSEFDADTRDEGVPPASSPRPVEIIAPAPASEPSGFAPPAAEAATDPNAPPDRAVLFPNCYVWCLFLGALDVMLTYLILHPAAFETRGMEVNLIASWVIDRFGVSGMVALKFFSVIVVVLICEFVGRRRYETARRLAEWAVAINSIPVIIAFTLMLVDIAFWRLGYTAA